MLQSKRCFGWKICCGPVSGVRCVALVVLLAGFFDGSPFTCVRSGLLEQTSVGAEVQVLLGVADSVAKVDQQPWNQQIKVEHFTLIDQSVACERVKPVSLPMTIQKAKRIQVMGFRLTISARLQAIDRAGMNGTHGTLKRSTSVDCWCTAIRAKAVEIHQ